MTRPAPGAGLRGLVWDVPDFPKKGVVFKDITPLLADPEGFGTAVRLLCEPFKDRGVEKVAGIESRGFLLAGAVARELGAGLVPLRKKGKLPRATLSESYALEYGTDCVEAHADAAGPGCRVLVVDDVLATGGTAAAACSLLERLGVSILGLAFLIELEFLKGREKVGRHEVHALLRY